MPLNSFHFTSQGFKEIPNNFDKSQIFAVSRIIEYHIGFLWFSSMEGNRHAFLAFFQRVQKVRAKTIAAKLFLFTSVGKREAREFLGVNSNLINGRAMWALSALY